MNRYRFTGPIYGLALATIATVGCSDPSTIIVPGPHFAEGTAVLVVWPDFAELMPGDQQVFTAFLCPLDVDGNWDAGPDGVPGTDDDDCFPVTAAWSVDGDIGVIAPTTGSSTTLSASLPTGSALEIGTVTATISGLSGDAEVHVIGGEEIKGPIVVPCVQFTSGGDNVGDKICREGSTYIVFTFDSAKKFKAEFGRKEFVAGDSHDGLKLVFSGAKVSAATWLNRTVPTPIKTSPSKTADLSFPTGSGGAIKAAAWNGNVPLRLPTPPAGKLIDDAHVTFERVKKAG